MDFQGIFDRLRAAKAPGLLDCDLPRKGDPADKKDLGRSGDAFVLVDPAHWADFFRVCKQDDRLGFEQLIDLSATDPTKGDENFWINVQLLSLRHKHRLAIKAVLPKDPGQIETLAHVYRAAQWHERECAEMFGITFTGHPDPRNILLPDDWVGSPLRKDYEFPKEYHGISCE